MHPLKTTSFALAGSALLALLAVQFLPWATFEATSSVPGFDVGGFSQPSQEFRATQRANTWDLDVTSSINGDERTSDEGWYDEGFDDEDGIEAIRAGAPVLLAGSAIVLVGAVLALGRVRAGDAVTLVGAAVVLVGTVTFAVGVNALFDDVDFQWSASFWLAIVACGTALAAGVTGLVAGNAAGARSTA